MSTAVCPACDRVFTSDTGFDRHLSGDRCLDPATMRRTNGRAKGMAMYRRVERVDGIAWALVNAALTSPYSDRKGA